MEEIPKDSTKKEFSLFKSQDSIDDETEDEEVKLNCVGGLRGYQESDFSSDSSEEDEVEEEGMEEHQSHEDGVVQFSCGRMEASKLGFLIIRPKPERLSPHQEERSTDEDAVSESSDASSVGARGTAISFGDSNVDRSSSDDEISEADDDEEQSDEESQTLTEDYTFLPKQSILHQLEASNKIVQPLTSQFNSTNVDCKAKRVLSSNTLAALNAEAGRGTDSPKRMRTAPEPCMTSIDSLPELSLGLSAIDAMGSLADRYSMRNDSPAISSEDDEELDRALSEELKRPFKISGDSSPVPLLTPPQSPLLLPTGYCDVVEWPSNLVVDSAMMSAATMARPLSLSSLQKFEEEEEVRLKDAYECPDPSSLTPLLRSIYVGID